MSKWVLCQKIWFLDQKLWPVACEHTHRQTQVLTTENPIRASAFQAYACDLIWAVQQKAQTVYYHLKASMPELDKNAVEKYT